MFLLPTMLLNLILLTIMSACTSRPDDAVSPVYELQKGQVLNEPALISVGLKEFMWIAANTSQDKQLADSKTNRPSKVDDYLNTNLYNPAITEIG